MQGYDLVMLGVLVAATIWGAYKGLAWQVASLASIVVSYLAALRYRATVAPMIPADEPWNMVLAMLAIFAGCSLAIWIVFRFVSELIDRVKIKEFDRQFGALLGFAKGVLLCVIITLFAVSLTSEPQRQKIIQSRSGHYISRLLAKSDQWIPSEVREVVLPYVDRFEKQLRGAGESLRESPPTADIEAPAATELGWPGGRMRIHFDADE